MMKRLLPQLMILFFVFTAGTSSGQTFHDAEDAYKKKNYNKAFKILKPLAEQGDAEAQSLLEETIAKAVEQRAEQGNAEAQLNLGNMYRNGQGVTKDYAKALKWYSLAAIQGNANAKNSLGFMYYQGYGVPQVYEEAFKWFRRAAEQGFAEAQFNLGYMYQKGIGIPQDYIIAHMWYFLSGSNGYNDAVNSRNKLEDMMTPQQIEYAQRRARLWKPNKK